MKNLRLFLACTLVTAFFSGCNPAGGHENANDEQARQNAFEMGGKLTLADFNISYRGIEIGGDIPFDKIASQLGVKLGDSDKNTDPRVILTLDGDEYGWYTLYYPSREQTDIEIDYVWNETKNTAWIVWVYLYKVETYRGLSVGDSMEKGFKLYGDNLYGPVTNFGSTEYYHYKLDESIEDKEIHIEADINSKIITAIFIDYCSNQSMEKLDIPSLID